MADDSNDSFWRVALKNTRILALNASSRGMTALPDEISVGP